MSYVLVDFKGVCPRHEKDHPSMNCSECHGKTLAPEIPMVRIVDRDWRPDLARVPDDHLRAECERRGYEMVSDKTVPTFHAMAALDSRRAQDAASLAEKVRSEIEAERDKWKHEHAALDAEYAKWRKHLWATLRELGCTDGVDPACFLRDLKRRAEAAEGALADIPRRNAEDALRLRDQLRPIVVRKLQESGAGITRMPERDNSIAHLDEDLLCEDA
jgi:hypothetical protein